MAIHSKSSIRFVRTTMSKYVVVYSNLYSMNSSVVVDGKSAMLRSLFRTWNLSRSQLTRAAMSNDELRDKSYLGDGVYCGHDGYHIWIWTSDGIRESEKIALELSAYENLVAYHKRINDNAS